MQAVERPCGPQAQSSPPPARIVTKNGLVHATILVAGTWQLEQGRNVLEPFAKLLAAARRELKDEAERLEMFVA